IHCASPTRRSSDLLPDCVGLALPVRSCAFFPSFTAKNRIPPPQFLNILSWIKVSFDFKGVSAYWLIPSNVLKRMCIFYYNLLYLLVLYSIDLFQSTIVHLFAIITL